jgi:hypothetical protein
MADTVMILDGPTIAAGQSLSDAIDCSDGRIVRITMPMGAWDFADLTFQISTDGVEPYFNDLYLANGEEYIVKAGPGRAIIINQAEWVPGLFLKFRSGTSAKPVPQLAARQFAVALLVPSP